jgi:hypothetical protein
MAKKIFKIKIHLNIKWINSKPIIVFRTRKVHWVKYYLYFLPLDKKYIVKKEKCIVRLGVQRYTLGNT